MRKTKWHASVCSKKKGDHDVKVQGREEGRREGDLKTTEALESKVVYVGEGESESVSVFFSNGHLGMGRGG